DALAGVRDCHVTVDVARRECIVYLAHTLVMPAFRRGGLPTLFRAAPLTLARRAIAAPGLHSADTLLPAEMEPPDRRAADPRAPPTPDRSSRAPPRTASAAPSPRLSGRRSSATAQRRPPHESCTPTRTPPTP